MRMRLTDIDLQYLMATRDGAGGFVDGARNEPSPTDPSR
jgi:hypothetical protein